ncbi:hypothetical protein FA95DRAFT_360135 [Auriscalpium vulgare]|uniref:Uncharacterized protein n=1 Tax=Auriscalpium vulgare TaxID=40419 RepID=A0ACB8RHN7_9AGAM|nr:hypothetical protein FA95DRAFT_360135 [Auriscalpium vulgare]
MSRCRWWRLSAPGVAMGLMCLGCVLTYPRVVALYVLLGRIEWLGWSSHVVGRSRLVGSSGR